MALPEVICFLKILIVNPVDLTHDILKTVNSDSDASCKKIKLRLAMLFKGLKGDQ
jgi:hypothetical protein